MMNTLMNVMIMIVMSMSTILSLLVIINLISIRNIPSRDVVTS